MPIFHRRRKSPLRRVRLAWLLAGCIVAVAQGDWPIAAARIASVLRLVRKEISRATEEAYGTHAVRDGGPDRQSRGEEGAG